MSASATARLKQKLGVTAYDSDSLNQASLARVIELEDALRSLVDAIGVEAPTTCLVERSMAHGVLRKNRG